LCDRENASGEQEADQSGVEDEGLPHEMEVAAEVHEAEVADAHPDEECGSNEKRVKGKTTPGHALPSLLKFCELLCVDWIGQLSGELHGYLDAAGVRVSR